MNEEEYIQEELAKSKARHPAFRGKIKLSNPDFNQSLLNFPGPAHNCPRFLNFKGVQKCLQNVLSQ